MQMILSWVVFPLVLTAVGAGWGVLVEKASGRRVQGALLLPLGLLAALIAAAMVTASAATAPAAVWIVGAIAVAGLAVAWPGKRISRWPLLSAIGVLFAYGAPIILSGDATFAGYIKLDDTATWLGITDQIFAHSRTVSHVFPNTYSHNLDEYINLGGYPIGSFMLLGIGHGLTGVNSAWLFQPDLAYCGVLVGLSVYALLERIVRSTPLRAGLAFIAAQPALLYGYSLWGGIKELTAAWVIIAGVALAQPYIGRAAPKPREVLPLALAAAALAITVGPATVVWVGPVLVVVAGSWLWAVRRHGGLRAMLMSTGTLAVLTAALALPMLVVASKFIAGSEVLYATPTGAARDVNALGNLGHPLSIFQLAGIWPIGDFRLDAPTAPTAIFVAVVIACAIGALVVCVRRREATIVVYVTVSLLSVGAVALSGGSPWSIAKALAIAAPALLVAGMLGSALLIERSRLAGAVTCSLIAGGVLWSNVLAFHDVRLAPRPRLAELQKIGERIGGRGPTLLNEFEIYGTRHFLGPGFPTAPAEYRQQHLALLGGQTLTTAAFADLDAFPASTILNYRTIVTRRSPTQSRPLSLYRLVWQGRWYQVWERPAKPPPKLVVHLPGGDSGQLPYCGDANQGSRALCSVDPVAIPDCSIVRRAARLAAKVGGRVYAYQHVEPIVARASAGLIPKGWDTSAANGRVTPASPGTMYLRFQLNVAQRYAVWLGGTFSRGFEVALDGRRLGRVSADRQSFGSYEHLTTVSLTRGRHTFAFTYPHATLGPGADPNSQDTSLLAVALDPLDGIRPQMLDLAPSAAHRLCGRTLDWIDVVQPHS